MLRSMHGMLSATVVMAAFAAIAGAGGYAAVWLYRAGPGRAEAPDEAQAPGEPEAHHEPEGADGSQEPDVPEEAEGPVGPGGLDGMPGARLYVLGEPRLPGR
jgi:hypothetical protein